jgi:hypothetical protein
MILARALIVGAFLIAFSLSISGFFERFSSATLFGFGSILTASGFLILHRLSAGFCIFLRARSLKRLTLAQTLRFYGLLALIKAHEHVLPALFAIPTAVMDVVIAVSSFYVASRLVSRDGRARPGYVAYHVMGLGTIAISATLAVLTSSEKFGLVKDGITSQPMTWFPMSLVPVFIGPMVTIFHLLALATVYENRAQASKLGFSLQSPG